MATGLGTFADAVGFGLLNDVLASFGDQNAYGRPNQYEVQIHIYYLEVVVHMLMFEFV